jgi:hypothetical protein
MIYGGKVNNNRSFINGINRDLIVAVSTAKAIGKIGI